MNDRLPNELEVQRIDLRALDPDLFPGGAERFTHAVLTRVRESATPPAIPLDPLYGLWSLPRTMLVAASFLVLLVLVIPRPATPAGEAPATVAEAVGAPSSSSIAGEVRP